MSERRAVTDDELQHRRIALERQECAGVIFRRPIGARGVSLRVEVEYAWMDDPPKSAIRGGYFRVVVPLTTSDGAAIKPALLAQDLVSEHFERRQAQRRGNFWWQIGAVGMFRNSGAK